MFHLRKGGFLWFGVGVLIGAVGAAALPSSAGESHTALARSLKFPAPVETAGHGSHCRVAGEGVYHYGRDFDAERGHHPSFARSCEVRGGGIGCVE